MNAGSWVKLEASRNGRSLETSPKLSDEEEMETLLADAVEEQLKQSRNVATSQGGKSDWVQAWASRPEQRPSK
eukprot:gene5491-6176_t